MQFIYVFLDFKNYQKSTFFARNTRQRIKWEFKKKNIFPEICKEYRYLW